MTLRILCIEDEQGLAEDLSLELEDAGYAVDVAPNGSAALDALANREYDLILCDVLLPDVSGIDVLAATIAKYAERPAPAFIMLTAYSDPMMNTHCRALGARHFLVKPVEYRHLINIIVAEFGV